MSGRKHRRIPPFDEKDVSVGHTTSSSGKGTKKVSARQAHVYHRPTGVKVECEPIPPKNYTNRQLRDETKRVAQAALPELERLVAAHYRKKTIR